MSNQKEIENFLEASYHEFLRKSENAKTNAARNALREAAFLHSLHQVLDSVCAQIPKIKYKPPKAKTNKRTINLVLSDLHFQSQLKPEETGYLYDSRAEARCLAEVVRQTADFKTHHRNETHLNVHLLGDIIQGKLHDPRDGATLTDQIAAATHLLSQAISFLASEFPTVTVYCETGNHGRNKARHNERATFEKWDSHETTIHLFLQKYSQAAGLKNVKFVIPKSPGYSWESYGELGFGTHGDTMVNIGNPGKTINVPNIQKQILPLSLFHSNKYGKPISTFVIGHLHLGIVQHPAFGRLIVNGALTPPDNFANSIGILECRRGQWIWESVPGHMIGDMRFAEVDEKTDRDSSLDTLIARYEGF